MRRFLAVAVAALCVLGFAVSAAQAQDYPTKPVKLLIGFPAGGLLDTVARIIGEKMASQLGQQFVIEARPGANSSLAFAALAKADPDGYTLMLINDNLSINPSVMKNIPFDSIRDFTPIGFVGSTPLVWNAHPGTGLKTVKDLVQTAKDKNGALTYGSVGPGSAPHLATEMFAAAAGIKMQHVPYRGGAPALNDLIGGHLNTMMTSPVISKAHIEAGRLVPITVAAKQRIGVLPNVPTMTESGYAIEAGYWFGLMGPAKMPPAVVAKLEKTLADVLAMPDVRKRLDELGAIVQPMNSREFGAYVQSEMVKWADVVKKANLKFE
jgi:tripartite-type tricarboxylate transporter receptor subunit TctC